MYKKGLNRWESKNDESKTADFGPAKVGVMNKTEAAYAATLDQRKYDGEVAWYRFEGMKFRLADNTFYTPDFVVLLADGALEAHEVKGMWQDDARAKLKIAADMYPLRFVARSRYYRSRAAT